MMWFAMVLSFFCFPLYSSIEASCEASSQDVAVLAALSNFVKSCAGRMHTTWGHSCKTSSGSLVLS
jgi:hypothetical protein